MRIGESLSPASMPNQPSILVTTSNRFEEMPPSLEGAHHARGHLRVDLVEGADGFADQGIAAAGGGDYAVARGQEVARCPQYSWSVGSSRHNKRFRTHTTTKNQSSVQVYTFTNDDC
jgi:hypothetical protein